MKHAPPDRSSEALPEDRRDVSSEDQPAVHHAPSPDDPPPTSPLRTGTHPFDALTPDLVLDALEHVGLFGNGQLLALNSYENRVYQVGMEDGAPVVVKFYRPQRWSDAAILEEHAFVRELAEQEIPAVPALEMNGSSLHHHAGFRFAVFPRRGGRAPELENLDTLEWLGRFIGRIHAVGARTAYRERPAIDIETHGIQPRALLLDGGFIPDDLVDAWRTTVDTALNAVRQCFARAGELQGPQQGLRLHGDCHAGNVLWTDAGPHFVDFDDSRTGPAIQDLWMLLSGSRADMTRQLSALLSGYEDFFEFDARELHRIEALRTLRLIHYSAWLAQRWDDPAFPVAFPWFGTSAYWQARIQELREQIALMDDPPLMR